MVVLTKLAACVTPLGLAVLEDTTLGLRRQNLSYHEHQTPRPMKLSDAAIAKIVAADHVVETLLNHPPTPLEFYDPLYGLISCANAFLFLPICLSSSRGPTTS
ncbi:hypothetical protein BX600DRAFT_454767 [Xylariales sp. PMI_506]|nr:hypothetical protein BX600DRAFT_454767 [Xylariales sp. PMI_506]